MKLKVLKKTSYEGVNIYVMHFGMIFQYLFAWNGEVFQNHIVLTPGLWKRFLGFFGCSMYTEEQMTYGTEVMISGATRSIEALKNVKKNKYTTAKKQSIPVNK